MLSAVTRYWRRSPARISLVRIRYHLALFQFALICQVTYRAAGNRWA